MWQADKKSSLFEAFASVAASEQRMEVDNGVASSSMESDTDRKIEENSGVKFPGECMEPYVGTSLAIDDLTVDKTVFFIEVSTPKFAFYYEDTGRVVIGSCEFCNKRCILRVECKCKRVKYCGTDCKKKDEHFHLPSCSA